MPDKKYFRDWYYAHREQILKDVKARRLQERENKATRPKPSKCDVCRRQAKRILWNHGHKSKRFRGWLCPRCNYIIALSKDNPKLLRELALYVELGQHYFDETT